MKSASFDATVYLIDSQNIDDALLLPYLAWLSPSETARYHRFMRPLRQRQFLTGRILLRLALARILTVSADSIVLTEQPNNAPLLHLPKLDKAPGFSLSHSGNWIACAVSALNQTGLDIELLNPDRDLDALSQRAFNAKENAWFASLPKQDRVSGFYQLWSTKEARYKLQQCVQQRVGKKQNEHCYVLSHPAISVVLCCEHALAAPPEMKTVNLPQLT